MAFMDEEHRAKISASKKGKSRPYMIGNKFAIPNPCGPGCSCKRHNRSDLKGNQRARTTLGTPCNRCPEEAQVIHHRDRDRSNNLQKNLESLCRSCHIEEHREELHAGRGL